MLLIVMGAEHGWVVVQNVVEANGDRQKQRNGERKQHSDEMCSLVRVGPQMYSGALRRGREVERSERGTVAIRHPI